MRIDRLDKACDKKVRAQERWINLQLQTERSCEFSFAHFLSFSRLMHNLVMLSLESTLFKVIFYVSLADTNFLFFPASSFSFFPRFLVEFLKEYVIYIFYIG